MSGDRGDWGDLHLPWHAGVRVLASGVGWVVVDKPTGVLSHPNSVEDQSRAVLPLPYDAGDESFLHSPVGAIHLCHRLDAPTSGLLLLASADLAGPIREVFASRGCRKIYRAWLKGKYPRDREVWRDRFERSREGKGVRSISAEHGLEAVTEVTVLKRVGGAAAYSEVILQPLTGRTHQLRVQSARRGFPIVGDATYGDFGFNRKFAAESGHKRLFLHAESLHLECQPRGRGKLLIAANSPAPFATAGG